MTMEKENELILQAQNGDIEAENAILKEYASLANAIARSYFVIGVDGDDIIQMGMIGLMRAVRSFKPEGGAAFKTYASACIRNSIMDSLRKENETQGDVNIDTVEIISDMQEPEKLFIEDETARLLLDTIASVLNEREMSVLKLFLETHSYEEISKQLGIERKKVDNTIYALRKKIKALLEGKK